MEYHYSTSGAMQKQTFLFGYYNRPILWFQRIFSGPVLISIGIYLFITAGNNEMKIIYSFFVIIGLYMVLRPVIILARVSFSDSSGRVIIENELLKIINEKGELIITQDELLNVTRKRHYVLLKVRINFVQYYVFDLNSFTNNGDALYADLSAMKGQ